MKHANILDSAVYPKSAPSVVTPAAYLLFYRRRSNHPLGGPKLEELLTANAPPAADPESRPPSRDASPSGEGPRLGDSSHNGSSSAFTTTGQVRHVGGGPAPMQIPGAYQEVENLERSSVQVDDNEILPGYEDMQMIGPQQLQPPHMDLDGDEGIDVSYPLNGHQTIPWDYPPGWGFDALTSGRAAPSQMTAVPPGSIDFNQDADTEEGLFENGDGVSMKAEGGDGSSAGNMSDPDETMKSLEDFDESAASPLIRRSERESAPPPHVIGVDEDEDDMPVVELRVDDDGSS
jgi:ubiquitin carboxyl-terminal hydrolase 4/11